MAETAFNGVEKRIAEACRKARNHTFDDAADGVEVILAATIRSSIFTAFSLSRTGRVSAFKACKVSIDSPRGEKLASVTSATRRIWDPMTAPLLASSWEATAPAKTNGAVSRPENGRRRGNR